MNYWRLIYFSVVRHFSKSTIGADQQNGSWPYVDDKGTKRTIRVHSELRGLSTMKFAFQAPFWLCTYHQEKYSKLTIRAFLKLYLRIKILAVKVKIIERICQTVQIHHSARANALLAFNACVETEPATPHTSKTKVGLALLHSASKLRWNLFLHGPVYFRWQTGYHESKRDILYVGQKCRYVKNDKDILIAAMADGRRIYIHTYIVTQDTRRRQDGYGLRQRSTISWE